MADYYNFGIEIELICKPHKVRSPLVPTEYYERLAASIRKRGLRAQADDLAAGYRKHREHHDKWWITRDSSLGDPSHPQIPLEAVSPILSTRHDWENEINTFWIAHRKVFHMPEKSTKCGSHVHVSPSGKKWSLRQLRDIAVGIVYFEALINAMLPAARRNNDYCLRNSVSSSRLKSYISQGQAGWQRFMAAVTSADRDALLALLQKERKVLWNFSHIVDGGIGTIEFRGGRGLRGERKSKWWIAFAVGYLHLLCTLQLHGNPRQLDWSVEELYKQIKQSGRGVDMSNCLPASYDILNDSREVCHRQTPYLNQSSSNVTQTAIAHLPRYPPRVLSTVPSSPPPAYSSIYRRAFQGDTPTFSRASQHDANDDTNGSLLRIISSLILRFLQLLLGIAVAGVYGVEKPAPVSRIYAEIVVGMSVITAVVCSFQTFRTQDISSVWELLPARKRRFVFACGVAALVGSPVQAIADCTNADHGSPYQHTLDDRLRSICQSLPG
ncbi:hypothetical protein LTR95_001396 [Oleoguttula sp. CCFEE 5521]